MTTDQILAQAELVAGIFLAVLAILIVFIVAGQLIDQFQSGKETKHPLPAASATENPSPRSTVADAIIQGETS